MEKCQCSAKCEHQRSVVPARVHVAVLDGTCFVRSTFKYVNGILQTLISSLGYPGENMPKTKKLSSLMQDSRDSCESGLSK